MARQVRRGIIDAAAMARRPSADHGRSLAFKTIGASDLAIEAATENEETKKAIFRSCSRT
jgi:3-hydroxybutyryl-CoA dehydrogenase